MHIEVVHSTLHLYQYPMLTKTVLELCDYCYEQHKELYLNHDNFNVQKKISVCTCAWCSDSMCQDCVENSKKYVQETSIEKYEIYLCANCILEKWSDMEYRTFVLHTIEKHEKYMRASLKKTILAWIQQPWPLPTWSNNISTSHWEQRKSVQKALSKHTKKDSVSLSSSLVTNP